ncbi:unnamed protein product, partial [Cladocopium goreaui]
MGIPWPTDLYEKLLYLAHMLNPERPTVAGPESMPVDSLKPRGELPKGFLDFALFLQVPFANSDEFGIAETPLFIEKNLSVLPEGHHLENFAPDESPVDFVMKQMSAIYPQIYQDWPDKLSDKALVRFCLHGLGAHRVDVEMRDGQKLFVIKTNALAGLPVKEGFERCGGHMAHVGGTAWWSCKGMVVEAKWDARGVYWRKTAPGTLKVEEAVEELLSMGLQYEGQKTATVCHTLPGSRAAAAADNAERRADLEPLPEAEHMADNYEAAESETGTNDEERAKFRFRSSLFVLVTLVDHLYDIHLQRANLFVTAIREKMSSEHPIRRFMSPFTYRTIGVNDNAFHNLIKKGGLGPRCFAFTEQGFGLAFAAAPSLVNGAEAATADKGPILFRDDYVAYLKKKGIDTEYWRQSLQIYQIYLRFVKGYLACYYPNKEDLAKDFEMKAMARQYFFQLEMASPSMLGRSGPDFFEQNTQTVEETYEFYAKWLAQIMLYVTAGHEQAGAVE